jgi:subtilase family serine protease
MKFDRALLLRSLGILVWLFAWYADQAAAAIPASIAGIRPKTRINRPVDMARRVALNEHTLPLLATAQDQGAVDPALRLRHMVLLLKSSAEQQAAIESLAAVQQTPNSPDYHRWLKPEEFASHFGVAAGDLQIVKDFLIANGFTIEDVAAGGRSISFSGSAAQVKQVFATEIHHYRWKGESHIANSGDPQIPAALADVVDAVLNLHNFFSKPQSRFQPVAKSSTGTAVANYNLGNSHYLLPGDYGKLYNINPLYNAGIKGDGITIAVLGRSNIQTNDVTLFQNLAQQANKAPQILITNSDPGLVTDDQTESSLDVEWAMGVAPGANTVLVTSASTANSDGVSLSAQYAVDHNIGDVITLSYGSCEKQMGRRNSLYWYNLWQQAQLQGQTVLVSSGDSGVAGCDSPSNSSATLGLSVNALCSSPYSTCVGGTQFLDTANPAQYWLSANPSGGTVTALGYIPEAVWNESAALSGGSGLWASGGGKSAYWSKPTWQAGNGVPADGLRDVPDLSLTAAQHDGYLIYMNSSMYIAGGTSAAAPALAAILALVEQYNGVRQGNINPTLYGLYRLQPTNGNTYFHTTLSGNNSVPGLSGYTANGTGYNLAAGLGSVDTNVLTTQWHNLYPLSSSVSVTGSAASINAGQSVSFTASITGFHPTGSVQFANNGQALAAPVALNNGQATLTAALLTPGSNSITANYSGDGNNLASTSNVFSETVIALTTVTISVSAPTIGVGQSLTLTATVTGNNPSGTVQFYLNGAALGSPVAVINGVAELTTNSLTQVGVGAITASYSGDGLNTASNSPEFDETVEPVGSRQVPALTPWMEGVLGLLLIYTMSRARKARNTL